MVDTDFLLKEGFGPNRDKYRDCFNQLMLRTEKRLRELIRRTLGQFQLVRRLDGSGVVLGGLQYRLYKRLLVHSVQNREEFFCLAVRELHRELLTLVRDYRKHLGDPKVPVQLPVDENGNEMTLEFTDHGHSPEDLARWESFYDAMYDLEGELGEVFRLRYLTDCSFEDIGKQYKPNQNQEAARKWASRTYTKACIQIVNQLGESLPAYFVDEMNSSK